MFCLRSGSTTAATHPSAAVNRRTTGDVLSPATPFHFEGAPDLPGSDRISHYGLAAARAMSAKLWDVTIEGIENVPATGAGIVASNHMAFCDSIFVPSAIPRRVWIIGKSEYLDDWKTRWLFPAFGMIPVDRTGGTAVNALDTGARVLDGGHLLLIYPEGSRSRSGNLHRGRFGAARLAIQCGIPIIPVGHKGTVDVQPPGQFLMRPFKKVSVKFGTPLHADDFGEPTDPRTRRLLTDAVMYEIAALSGQNYVHTYANSNAGPQPMHLEFPA